MKTEFSSRGARPATVHADKNDPCPTLHTLLDPQQLAPLMEAHFAATGIPGRLVDANGTVLVETGWRDLCAETQSATFPCCGECDRSKDFDIDRRTITEFVCPLGFAEFALPIVLRDRLAGALSLGQFYYEDEAITEVDVRNEAIGLGLDGDQAVSVLRSAPIFERDQIWLHIRYCQAFVELLISMAEQNLALQEEAAQRAAAKASLQVMAQRFHDVIEGTPTCMLVVHNDVVTFANAAAARQLDASTPDELIGSPVFQFIHPDDQAIVDEHMARIAQGERDDPLVIRIRTLTGAYREMEVTSMPFQFEGKPATLAIGSDVTDRRRKEQTILQAKREWERTVDAVPDLICIIDNAYRIIRVNKPFAERMGRTPQECIGKLCYQLVHNRDEPPHRCPHALSLQNGTEHTIEFFEAMLDGYFSVTAAPIFDQNNERMATVQVMHEITTERQARKSIENRLRLLEMLTSLTTRFVGLPAAQVEASLVDALGAVAEFLGADAGYIVLFGPKQQLAHVAYEWKHPEHPCQSSQDPNLWSHPPLIEHIARYETVHIDSSRTIAADLIPLQETLSLDGIKAFVAVPSGPIDTPRGYMAFSSKTDKEPLSFESLALLRILGNLVSNLLEGKEIEEALRASEARERNRADEIQTLLDVVPAVVLIAEGKERSIIRGNRFAESLFRFPEAKRSAHHDMAQEQNVRVFMGDVELAPHNRPVERAAQTGETFQNCELRLEVSDNPSVFLMGNVTPVFDEQGVPRGSVGAFMDITERKQAEEERLRLEGQFQHAQKLESLGVLAGGIAHDFNNLLMAILGNADLALLELPPGTGARNNLIEIGRTARRAADLCRQMLAYSGRGHFVVAPLDLQNLVEEMGQMLEVSISKKVTLRFEFAENLPAIEADATQIRQIVMNLIVNASEAIGDKTGVISVRLGCIECDERYLSQAILGDCQAPGFYVYLEISDTGCGMDEATLAKMFEPFYTTKFTGRGLGMSAVLGIVRGHNGAIHIQSSPGKGTTFRVLFPARDDADVKLESATNDLRRWRGTGTLLLADDEESIRSIGKLMLEKVGFDVLTARDGEEAVALFQAHPSEIRCVILDLTMPNMDGIEAFDAIHRICNDVPVILSSGYNECEVQERLSDKGLQGFIQKPYQLSKLLDALRDALENPKRV